MAKLIEYDVQGVEEGGGGTGVKAPIGVYVARIALCEQRDKKNDGSPANDIRVGLDVGKEYDWVFTYVGLGPESDWKLAEFVRALGLKEKGKINPDKLVADKKLIRVKLNPDTYDGAYSPAAGRLMALQDGDEEPGPVSGTISPSSTTQLPGTDEEPSDEATSEKTYSNPDFVPFREGQPDPTDESGDTIVGSYEDWPEDDLYAECEDRGITLPGGRGSKKDKAIKALRDEDAEVAGADDSDDDTGDEPEATDEAAGDDYDEWDLDRLKQEWEERQLGDLPAIRGNNAEARLTAKLIEALRADDEANPFEG